jgi:hypothetical protein
LDGWIKLHRKLLENPIIKNPQLLQLAIYCLLNANHKPKKAFWGKDEIDVQKGQFITGRYELAKDLKCKPITIYKRMLRLSKTDFCNIKSNNKNTLVTIVNWELYQSDETESNINSNNKVTTKEQQSNTTKNVRSKEVKKESKDIGALITEFAIDEGLKTAIQDFIEMRKLKRKPPTERAMKDIFKKLNTLSPDIDTQIKILERSIINSWTDIYPLKEEQQNSNPFM